MGKNYSTNFCSCFEGCRFRFGVPKLNKSMNFDKSMSKIFKMTDLYRKPTDRNRYLLTSSCHPAHVTNNIPFSLALRIVRICSDKVSRDTRLEELNKLLLSRNYKPEAWYHTRSNWKSKIYTTQWSPHQSGENCGNPATLHYDPLWQILWGSTGGP